MSQQLLFLAALACIPSCRNLGALKVIFFLCKADKKTPFFLVYLRLSTMAKFPKDYHQEKSENDKKLAVIIKLKKQKIGQVRLLSWVNILSTISLGFDLNLHSYTPVLFSSTRFLSSVIADIQHDLDQVYLTVAAIMDYMIQKCWEPPSTVIPLFAIVLLHLV